VRRPWRRPNSERALEDAATLVAKGKVLAAIDLLSRANRNERDVRIEEELLDLRYRAYALASHPTERPVQPDHVPDLFPGTVVPEIQGAALTAEAVRSAILCHGSVIVRGLMGRERVSQLVGDIDRVFDAYDAHRQNREMPERDAWFQPFKYEETFIEREFRRRAGGVLAVDSPRAMFDVIEAFEECGVGDLVRHYFEEPAALLAKKWTLRRIPHDASPSDWHQDGSFMGKDIRSLDVWVALSHCGDDAPGIDVVGRRLEEIVERGTEGAHLKWTVGRGVVDRVAEGSVVRPIFEPGDALIFDHMNLHCTAVDPGMINDRYAIEAWFFAPSTYASMTNMYTEDEEMKIPADQIPIAY
jgi:Phytanoyl-CoA dioxygenase (PhyH)